MKNRVNTTVSDSKFTRELSAVLPRPFCVLKNTSYLFFGKARPEMFFSSCSVITESTFLHRIVNVLLGCSKKEMTRIAARRIIASVTYIKCKIKLSSRKQVGQSVGNPLYGSMNNRPVTVSESSTNPRPTLVKPSYFHFGPKPYLRITPSLISSIRHTCSTFSGMFAKLFLHKLVYATSPARQGAGAPFIVPTSLAMFN